MDLNWAASLATVCYSTVVTFVISGGEPSGYVQNANWFNKDLQQALMGMRPIRSTKHWGTATVPVCQQCWVSPKHSAGGPKTQDVGETTG